MKHFDANESARNRLSEDAILSQLCREWIGVRRIEFIGGPRDGRAWIFDEIEQAEGIEPVHHCQMEGGAVHVYELVGDRYMYGGAR